MAGQSGRVVSKTLIVAALALTITAGCSRFSGADRVPLESLTAEQIYQLGEADLNRKRTEEAAFNFSEVERLYPYSAWAKRAVIMQAYAYHLGRDYDNARAAATRYLAVYPAGEDAAYAQYLLALSYYDQIDDIGRDQALTLNALQELRKVIEQYPDSDYAEEAAQKFDLAFDHLAGKEMEVGRYYLARGEYTAAANRFRTVVDDFKTTRQTPEALYRLVEAYLALGMTNEAQTAGAILARDFADTPWHQDAISQLSGQGLPAQAMGDNWLSAIYRQTIKGAWL